MGWIGRKTWSLCDGERVDHQRESEVQRSDPEDSSPLERFSPDRQTFNMKVEPSGCISK